jgi:replicative DNA helicase
MKPKFKENDPGLMKIKYGVAAVERANTMLQMLADKYQGKKALPAAIPVTLPHTIFYGPGGCHAAGTGILMYDGSIKTVEDIEVGDLIMGPDSTPRLVLQLVRGKEQMYKITLPNKHSFVVNENHMLNLKRTRAGKKHNAKTKNLLGKDVSITVKNYLEKSKTFKAYHKLYQPQKITFNSKKKLIIDPYMLGVLLGDAYFGPWSVSIINPDKEIEEHAKKLSKQRGLKISYSKDSTKCKTYSFWSFKGMNTNSLILDLKQLNLFDKKSGTKFYTAGVQSSR